MRQPLYICLLVLTVCISGFSQSKSDVDGAWQLTDRSGQSTIVTIVANYLMQTTYTANQFIATRGGAWKRNGGKLSITVEFDTKDSGRVGQVETYNIAINNRQLTLDGPAGKQVFSRLDEPTSSTPMAGLWRITGRVNETGQRTTMQAGPRKTIKLLTRSRFQWAAINPQTKQFMGTGGGTYLKEGDQYTETIDFFSRDNSRVGRSLTFTVNLTGDDWQHTGKSSTGGVVNEVWSREK
ncbi:membrane or secreted protein [Fibrella aquatica]|uniref:membrane or secreted protein n=1 Tax=Fibrella aquatica TaxID=3242487 RepID=UPI0035200A5F